MMETNPPVHGHATDHEERDIPYITLAKWTAALIVAVGIVITLTYFLFGNPTRRIDSEGVMGRKMSQPTLQTNDAADMKAFRESELEHLNGVGWVDRAKGTVHIPISQAIDQVLQKGLPARAAKQ